MEHSAVFRKKAGEVDTLSNRSKGGLEPSHTRRELATVPLSCPAWILLLSMNPWLLLALPAFAGWPNALRRNLLRRCSLSTSFLVLSNDESLNSAKQRTSPAFVHTMAHFCPLSCTYLIAVAVRVVWNSDARDSMVSKLGTEFSNRGENKDSGISNSAANIFASASWCRWSLYHA